MRLVDCEGHFMYQAVCEVAPLFLSGTINRGRKDNIAVILTFNTENIFLMMALVFF